MMGWNGRRRNWAALVLAVAVAAVPYGGFGGLGGLGGFDGFGGAGTAEAADGIFEAEDAAGSGIIVDNKHPGFTGTGFVDYSPNVLGGWVEWTVPMPAAGEYTLEFRYAIGAADDRPAEIQVNGAVVAAPLPFPSTGDWTAWRTSTVQATLVAGENVIRATATGASGGPNIDHLRIHTGTPGGGEPAPSGLQPVALTDIVDGLLMKKLKAIGMIGAEKAAADPIARIEFMAMMNDALGYTAQNRFPHVDVETHAWETPLAEWDAYVLEAAKDAGYVRIGDDGLAQPDAPLKRKDAANMIARALQLTKADEDGNGSVGAVVRAGYISAEGGRGFGEQDYLTVEEARQIAARIGAEAPGAPHIGIAGVHAIGDRLVAVTLNGALQHIDYQDLALSAPTGSWRSLTPAFHPLQLRKAASGTNRFGHTVVVYEMAETLGSGATYAPPKAPPQFSGNVAEAVKQAQYYVSWQMDHGGWTKSMPYHRAWNGVEPKSSQLGPTGTELGTIDNSATIKEIRYIAEVYRATGDVTFRESVRRGIEFLLDMQYETGGWPQVYPERGKPGDSVYYSNYVTFNDNAMINVLDLIDDIVAKSYPFDTGLVNDATIERLKQARDKGIEYILKSQIIVDGKLTAWCAQHDPFTYEPRGARAYEHPSISGSESVGIVRYLTGLPEQTDAVRRAVHGALTWFDEAKLENIRYVSADPNGQYFVEEPGAVTWYRFYEIGTNRGIFSGRDGVIKYSIQEIEKERRDGYSWGGSYAKKLLETAETTGYYGNYVYAQVVKTGSSDAEGRTLRAGEARRAEDVREVLGQMPNELVVAQDGTGDYATVQAAVDAVPANNAKRVTIFIKNGVYREVVTVPANKPFVTMIGESAEGTVITYDNYSGKERPTGGTYGTSGSASMFVFGNDFEARHLTIENSFDESSVSVTNKQAVALNVRGERQSFENVRFIGNQDTLLTNGGTQYFYQCYIEGDVDFIFGGSRAVFEECVIHSLDRGSQTNNGYITAASTLITEPYGYLILNSKLTSDAAPGTVWLGRPWHPGGNPDAIASVVYMNCEMGAHINPIGWTDMSGFSAKDARFAEYRNYGPGAVATDTRPQLSDEEAASWTIENVLKGWNPKAE